MQAAGHDRPGAAVMRSVDVVHGTAYPPHWLDR